MRLLTGIGNLFSRPTGDAALPPVAREAVDALERRKQQILAEIREHYDRLDTLIDPLERYRDGDRIYHPSGYLRDRQRGDSWPLLVTQEDLRRYRGDSRLLVDTNSYAAGFLDRLCDFVIGDGHTPTLTLRGASSGAVSTGVTDRDEDGRPDAAEEVTRCQAVVDEFRELNEWGHGPQDREEESYRRLERDGELFVRFFEGGSDTGYVPTVRFVEPEQVDNPPGMEVNQSWGIETDPDDVETVRAFYVRSLSDLSGKGDWVKAEQIAFTKLNTDRTVKRGISSFAVVAEAFTQAEKINRNMAEVSAIQAAIAYIRQHAPGILPDQINELVSGTGDYTTRPRNYAGRDRTVPVQFADPGQVVDMSAGMTFTAGPASQANPAYVTALQSRLRQVCARFGMPEFFTGDASNNNYASILVSGGPFERSVKRRQRRFAGFQAEVYRRALRFAVKAGRLRESDYRAVKVEVECPGVSIANQLEEAQVRQIESQNGVLSPQTWMVQAGYDPKVESANKEAWDAKFGDAMSGMGGGDPFGGGSPFGEHECTQGEYDLLSEADRSHLVFDRTKKRWVNPNKVLKQNPVAKAAGEALKGSGLGELLDWNKDPKTGQIDLLVKRPDGRRELITPDELDAELKQKAATLLGTAKPKLDRKSAPAGGNGKTWKDLSYLPKTAKRLTITQVDRALVDLGLGERIMSLPYDLKTGTSSSVIRLPDESLVVVDNRDLRAAIYGKKPLPTGTVKREGYTQGEYDLLSEADRSHLVFDRTKKRWVNPNRERPGERRQKRAADVAAARRTADELIRSGVKTPADARRLAESLKALPVADIAALRRAHAARTGGRVKQEQVDRLVAYAKGRGSVAPVQPPTDPPPALQSVPADAVPPPRAELEAAVMGTFEDLLADKYAAVRMVPIHEIRAEIRSRFGERAASSEVFNDLLLDMRRAKKVRLLSIDDRSRATEQQLADSIFAVGETFFYVERMT